MSAAEGLGNPVGVPARVSEGLEAVRASGEVEMFDSLAVQALATRMGYREAVCWIERRHTRYIAGVIYGFVPEER